MKKCTDTADISVLFFFGCAIFLAVYAQTSEKHCAKSTLPKAPCYKQFLCYFFGWNIHLCYSLHFFHLLGNRKVRITLLLIRNRDCIMRSSFKTSLMFCLDKICFKYMCGRRVWYITFWRGVQCITDTAYCYQNILYSWYCQNIARIANAVQC